MNLPPDWRNMPAEALDGYMEYDEYSEGEYYEDDMMFVRPKGRGKRNGGGSAKKPKLPSVARPKPKVAELVKDVGGDRAAWAAELFKAVDDNNAQLIANSLRKLLPTDAATMELDDPVIKVVRNAFTRLEKNWKGECDRAKQTRIETEPDKEPVWMGGFPVPAEVFSQIMYTVDQQSALDSSATSKGWYKSTSTLPHWTHLNFSLRGGGGVMWSKMLQRIDAMRYRNPWRTPAALTIGHSIKVGAMKSLKAVMPQLQYLDLTAHGGFTHIANYHDLSKHFPNLKGLACDYKTFGSRNLPFGHDLQTLGHYYPNLQYLDYTCQLGFDQCNRHGGLRAHDIVRLADRMTKLRRLQINGFNGQSHAHTAEGMEGMMVALATKLPELTFLELRGGPVSAGGWRAFLKARRDADLPPLKQIAICVPYPQYMWSDPWMSKNQRLEEAAADRRDALDPVKVAAKKAREEEQEARRSGMVPGIALCEAFAADGICVSVTLPGWITNGKDEDGEVVTSGAKCGGLVCFRTNDYKGGSHRSYGCLWMMEDDNRW
ncbi:hypothetical protein JKP88DRAFT_353657 [Tribonema minus]|uniref:F-box domain-containing protein n=1 Tax=Tribonema minus TaxID=303371 RepID=A0A835Z736_9STRA|nr:hypothetical protein JKP88DRAFT_353657 [Tribonema minus]